MRTSVALVPLHVYATASTALRAVYYTPTLMHARFCLRSGCQTASPTNLHEMPDAMEAPETLGIHNDTVSSEKYVMVAVFDKAAELMEEKLASGDITPEEYEQMTKVNEMMREMENEDLEIENDDEDADELVQSMYTDSPTAGQDAVDWSTQIVSDDPFGLGDLSGMYARLRVGVVVVCLGVNMREKERERKRFCPAAQYTCCRQACSHPPHRTYRVAVCKQSTHHHPN